MPHKDTQTQRQILSKIAPSKEPVAQASGADVETGDAVAIPPQSPQTLELQQTVSTLSAKFTTILNELEHIRSATKGSGQRLLTQIESLKNETATLQSALTRQGRLTTEIRSDVDTQHRFDLQTKDELEQLGRHLAGIVDSVELLQGKQNQTAVEVAQIRKRHFSVLTISVAAALSIFFIAMTIASIGRRTADSKTLQTLEQYVIRHEQILQEQ